MSQQPGYRRPARVRPGSGHGNWCSCQGCRRDIAQFEASQFKGTLIVAAIVVALTCVGFAATAPFRIWHETGSDGSRHPDAATWIAYGIICGVIVAALMFFSIRAAAARRPVVTPASLAQPPPSVRVPAPPVCLHVLAVEVDESYARRFGVKKILAWWCPDCETQLPAGFVPPMRPCCGTPPGGDHWWNCAQAGMS